MEFNLFVPQMRLSFDQLVTRAQAAEAAGFVGITGMDHLAPPQAEDQPMFEAVVTTTWLAAHTQRMKVGSLVLCDAFRLPAILARPAVSIQQMGAPVGRGDDRHAISAEAKRRFGFARPVVGTGGELVDHYGHLAEQGIERVYTWFCDFARPETLAEFGETVIAPLRRN